MNYGERLRELMNQKGRTVEDLSLGSGVPSGIIYQLLRDRSTDVKFWIAARLAHQLSETLACWADCDGIEEMTLPPPPDSISLSKREREARIREAVPIGDLIRRERKKRRMQLRALADASKLSYSTLSKIESGVIQAPKLNDVIKIANALKLCVDSFERAKGVTPGTQLPPKKSKDNQKRGPIATPYYDKNSNLRYKSAK